MVSVAMVPGNCTTSADCAYTEDIQCSIQFKVWTQRITLLSETELLLIGSVRGGDSHSAQEQFDRVVIQSPAVVTPALSKHTCNAEMEYNRGTWCVYSPG